MRATRAPLFWILIAVGVFTAAAIASRSEEDRHCVRSHVIVVVVGKTLAPIRVCDEWQETAR